MVDQTATRNMISSYSISDQGMTRTNNEDWVDGFEPNDPTELMQSGSLYVVADGVGGAQHGERASQYAARKILYEYYQHPDIDPADRLASIIQTTGNEIYRYSLENGVRMATTLVAAVVTGDGLTVANVGDSRAYLIRSGQVTQITHDHNRAAELVRIGALSSEEARDSKTKNTLTRSLGGNPDEEVDLFTDIQLVPGDKILLCTDGLTRYATDQDLVQLTSNGSLEENGKQMVDFANKSGGVDNITLYLIKVEEGIGSGVFPKKKIAPEAIDWDTVNTIPSIRSSRRIKKKSVFTGVHQLITLLAIVTVLLIATVAIGFSLVSKANKGQATPSFSIPSPEVTNLPGSFSSAIAKTEDVTGVILSETPTTMVDPTNQNPMEQIDTPAINTSPTVGKQKCVHLVKKDENPVIIFRDYFEPDAELPDNDTYKIYWTCIPDEKYCYGNFFLVDATSVPIESFLVVPGVEEENCNPKFMNYWVTITYQQN